MELKTIFSESRPFKIGDDTIQIKTLCVGDIPTAIELVGKYISLFNIFGKGELTNQVVIKAIGDNWPGVTALLKITTDIPEDKIMKLRPDALIIIMSEVVKENMDFLQSNVTPLIKEVFKKMNQKVGLDKSKS